MADNKTNREELASKIIDAGVYKTFWDKPRSQWSKTQQGRICPAFCNLRSLIGSVELRDTIEDSLVEYVTVKLENYPDVICGVVSSGVPWATLLSKRLDLPLCYSRPTIKQHGNHSSLEGDLKPGMKALLIDDVYSTGSTVRKTSFQLGATGVEIASLLVILRLGGETARIHQPSGSFISRPVDSLIDYNDLVKVAELKGMMNKDQADQLLSYYKDPETQPWD